MLFECRATKKLWNELTYLFQQKEQTKIKPSITTCIIGTTYKEETMCKWNFIATCMRQHIYETKFHDKQPNLKIFLAKFNHRLLIYSINHSSTEQTEKYKKMATLDHPTTIMKQVSC